MKNKDKVEILRLKVRKYLKTIKGINDQIVKSNPDIMALHQGIKSDISDGKEFKDLKKSLRLAEVQSREFGAKTRDVENYLLKIGTIIDCLEDLGEKFETEDKEYKEIIKASKELTKDSNIFTYGYINDKIDILDKNKHKEIESYLSSMIDEETMLKNTFNKIKSFKDMGS